MSARRQPSGLPFPVRLLVVAALLEVAVERIAVPMLRPKVGAPPAWHVALDYAGLFLFYFTGALAVLVVLGQCIAAVRAPSVRDRVAHGFVAFAALLAAVPLVLDPPAALTIALEIAFAVAVIALVVAGFGRGDRALDIGFVLVALPLLLHSLAALGARFWWADVPVGVEQSGPLALSFAALLSPYVFAPRPFARAAARPGPVALAMVIAALGALAARMWYARIAQATALAIGLSLDARATDPRLALYLLSLATLAWTFTSCAIAASPARRAIGTGLVFVVLGGYAFHWPSHFLLPLLGLVVMVRAAHDVRADERAAAGHAVPSVADAAWATYVGQLAGALEPTLAGVHTLTSRVDGDLASTIVTGDAGQTPVRVRIERIAGSVIALDVVVGREVDELRGATFAVWTIPERGLGTNPSAPAAAPRFATGDSAFDRRFEVRGNALAFSRLFDSTARTRAIATFDGWLAYWEREGLRYRVYPGRGAPLDQPIPLAQLAAGAPAGAERLAAVIALLVDIGGRAAIAADEPAVLARDVS